jgi:hypothetical protein
MKLVELSKIFDVGYGNKFDLNKMSFNSGKKVAFIGRTAKNNGVTSVVDLIDGIDPYPAGFITVNLGGAILESFIQVNPFYTAQNIMVLKPKSLMSELEKAFYCIAIKANKFRYGAFGREANRSLKELLVPETVPKNFLSLKIQPPSSQQLKEQKISFSDRKWKWFEIGDEKLFELKKGKRLTKANMEEGETPFVGSTELENGITGHISAKAIHKGNTISVTYNGSVAEAFYQPVDFWASDDVNVLYPKFELNPYRALFLTTIIRKEKYRFNYGRKWHLERMKQSKIKLPVDSSGNPDWQFMEDYIKSLPYSKSI